jgi:hypothetical protein
MLVSVVVTIGHGHGAIGVAVLCCAVLCCAVAGELETFRSFAELILRQQTWRASNARPRLAESLGRKAVHASKLLDHLHDAFPQHDSLEPFDGYQRAIMPLPFIIINS